MGVPEPGIPMWANAVIGGGLNIFEISTLGQPFEVIKTHQAANRGDNLMVAMQKTWQRGGIAGFYQGLIPWAWLEAGTKGGVILLSSSFIEENATRMGASKGVAGLLGGSGGGVVQAYTTMAPACLMKTIEVTRAKGGPNTPSTLAVAADIIKKEGIAGMYRGVSAVALRQMTNWGTRFGVARLTEQVFQGGDKTRKLTKVERLSAAVLGGATMCWNQPLEIIRVEMQTAREGEAKPSFFKAAQRIYAENGLAGFYRAVIPRMGLSIYLTTVMVFGGDEVKIALKEYYKNKNKVS